MTVIDLFPPSRLPSPEEITWETVWDLKAHSRFRPPAVFRAYDGADQEDTLLCAMETVSLALGSDPEDLPADRHPAVHPILGMLIRVINDSIDAPVLRTGFLWARLPLVIGTGTHVPSWERDIYVMAVDRRLSAVEYAWLASDAHSDEWDGDALSMHIKETLEVRGITPDQTLDLLDFATRGYWYTAKRLPVQTDWNDEQYARIQAHAGVR
jgi:hypothetical protein